MVRKILKYLSLLLQVVVRPSSLNVQNTAPPLLPSQGAPRVLDSQGVHAWADKELDYLTSLSNEIVKMHEQIMELNVELQKALALTCVRRRCKERESL